MYARVVRFSHPSHLTPHKPFCFQENEIPVWGPNPQAAAGGRTHGSCREKGQRNVTTSAPKELASCLTFFEFSSVGTDVLGLRLIIV